VQREEAVYSPASDIVYINLQRFRGGLAFKAHRLLYHSTLGLSVMNKKKIALSRSYWKQSACTGLKHDLRCEVWGFGFRV